MSTPGAALNGKAMIIYTTIKQQHVKGPRQTARSSLCRYLQRHWAAWCWLFWHISRCMYWRRLWVLVLNIFQFLHMAIYNISSNGMYIVSCEIVYVQLTNSYDKCNSNMLLILQRSRQCKLLYAMNNCLSHAILFDLTNFIESTRNKWIAV